MAAYSLLTDPQIGGQIDCPPKALSFFSNGEPCYAQSIASQLLGAASHRRGRNRDRGSTADRARVRSAVDFPILKQAVCATCHRTHSVERFWSSVWSIELPRFVPGKNLLTPLWN